MKKRTIFYDFKNGIDFDLPSRRKLEKRLGDYDVLAEYTMCAVREMECRLKEEEDKNAFFVGKLQEHNVNMGSYVDYPQKERDLCMLFMVNTNAMLNDFVNLYARDIRELINPTFVLPGDAKLSKVDGLMVAFENFGITIAAPEWLIQCLNYYRFIRNSIAHNDGEKRKCQDAFEAINIDALYKDYPIFNGKAPNPVDMICMDDFYFYSACVKHFANYTVMALKGRVDWSNLGSTHPLFQPENIPSGTNPKTWINRVLNEYHSQATLDDREKIFESIKAKKDKK